MSSVIHEVLRTARQDYVCRLCHGVIGAGSRNVVVSQRNAKGRWESGRYHVPCSFEGYGLTVAEKNSNLQRMEGYNPELDQLFEYPPIPSQYQDPFANDPSPWWGAVALGLGAAAVVGFAVWASNEQRGPRQQ